LYVWYLKGILQKTIQLKNKMDTSTKNIIVQYFQHLYDETDQQMALLKPVCKRGCPWCCYQSVEILNWEEPTIKQFIVQKIKGRAIIEIKNNLEK